LFTVLSETDSARKSKYPPAEQAFVSSGGLSCFNGVRRNTGRVADSSFGAAWRRPLRAHFSGTHCFASTLTLREFLRAQGYEAHEWGLGLNLGPREGVLDACLDRVKRLRSQSGRKVSLIGWSLGGIYAREMAKLAPEDVRCVITLGTPFTGSPRATNAWGVYELASGERVDSMDNSRFASPPPVPTTSIFSRTDGVVAWQCSLERETSKAENIEVDASHVGLGAHPAVIYAIADRLAQPDGAWKKFDRTSGLRSLFYKDSHRDREHHGVGTAALVIA
jgi:Alpha/beta hydrolase family